MSTAAIPPGPQAQVQPPAVSTSNALPPLSSTGAGPMMPTSAINPPIGTNTTSNTAPLNPANHANGAGLPGQSGVTGTQMGGQPGTMGPPAPPFTILRIKRKRTEEPLEALVVESSARRKKSRGPGVFQYAKTVEEDAWTDIRRQKDIQDEVTRLAEQQALEAAAKQTAPLVPMAQPAAPPSPLASRKPREDRRYTIIEKPEVPSKATPQKRNPTAPPKVYSSKELEAIKAAASSDIQMYDAVPEMSAAGSPMQEDDEEMDKFLPMLQDYLKVHDTNDVSGPLKPSSALHTNGPHHAPPPSKDESEYVWDVFYHRPATSMEWNAIAMNVGTISGLPPSLEGYDSASDSEEEFDEADEDSNAEEYYKNDYPDEEEDEATDDDSGTSDEFHEESDYDDVMDLEDNAEEFNFPRA